MEGGNTVDFKEDLIPSSQKDFRGYQNHRPTQQEKIEEQEQIRQKIHVKYQKYYDQWRDFQMLTMILAMIGVVLAIKEQEDENLDYHERNVDDIKANSFIRVIITITTFLGVLSLLFRNWLYIFWKDFDNAKELQIKFLELEVKPFEENDKLLDSLQESQRKRAKSLVQRRKKYIKHQKESNLKKWIKTLLTTEFLFEFTILILHPLPYIEEEYTFYILNMLGNKNQLVPVKYMLGDFLFAFMFLRFYFVIRTITIFSVFSDLHSKKVCQKYGFKSDTGFFLKANMKKNTTYTVVFVFFASILWLSYILRIFEKIYYQSQGQRVFDSYITAIWCVVITMTTVGYGDVYAVSPFGRFISVMNAIWGAFVISMLVSSIGKIFDLNDKQKHAIVDITNSKQAAKSLKASFRYFVARAQFRRRQHEEENGLVDEQTKDYVVNKQELQQLKQQMIDATDAMRAERHQNVDVINKDIEAEDVETIKEQILDLNDKFDFLVSLMIQNHQLEPQIYQDDDGNQEVDFTLREGEDLVQDGYAPIKYKEILDFVEKFEQRAKKQHGEERKPLRRPEPIKPLTQRVEEAVKYYAKLQTKKND